VTELGHRRSRATVSKALQLAAAVLRSAVRNRLIPFNPADEVRVPGIRQLDNGDRIISRQTYGRGCCRPFPSGTAA